MPLYFAYGANMDTAAMARRCPRSRALGVARLARRRFFIMPSGFASIARDPRMSVYGLLWELAPGDVPALDRYEDVARGLYEKTVQPALRQPFGHAQALVYIGRETGEGVPRPGYLEGVIAAARAAALPAAYVAYLEHLLVSRDPRR